MTAADNSLVHNTVEPSPHLSPMLGQATLIGKAVVISISFEGQPRHLCLLSGGLTCSSMQGFPSAAKLQPKPLLLHVGLKIMESHRGNKLRFDVHSCSAGHCVLTNIFDDVSTYCFHAACSIRVLHIAVHRCPGCR